MRPRLKKLLIALGVVVLAIIGFLLFNNYSPLYYYIAHPKNYAQCIGAHGTHLNDRGVETCIFKDKLFVDHKIKNEAK